MKWIAAVLGLALPLLAAGPPIDKAKALGSPTAPIMLEVFSDFQCPMCKAFHQETLPLLMREFVIPGKVYIVSREFPLNRADHPFSKDAAAYATAAARINQYGPVTDSLFRDQESIEKSGKLWDSVAKGLSLDQQKRIQALAKDPEVLKEVQDDANYAMSLGVGGTPTVNLVRGSKHFLLTGTTLNYTLLKSMINDMAK